MSTTTEKALPMNGGAAIHNVSAEHATVWTLGGEGDPVVVRFGTPYQGAWTDAYVDGSSTEDRLREAVRIGEAIARDARAHLSRLIVDDVAEVNAALDGRQPREHPVPCQRCREMTWNVSALCDDHDEVTG